MAKSKGGSTKLFVHVALRSKKRKAEEVLKTCKKKKISSEGESDSEESSRDTNRYEDDHLSLPICARDILGELYDLETLLDKVGSFPAKISIRLRMTIHREFWKILIEQKFYNEFKGTCFGHLRHIPDYFKFNGLIAHYIWYTSKSDNIVEGDPFKYKGRSTKIVHPYLTPTVREMGQNYMKTFKPYTDEVKDAIDVLKTQLKGVNVLTAGDEYFDDHNIIQPCVNFVSSRQKNVPSTSKDGNLENLSDRVVSLK
ncbi:hypothetical protein R3W88_029493 [Solanum pinnatisectum]|uniref:Uncharacterized protein n=1 Tax=Solanum pinnatisectum TaxID=50273 RepID=A0AAV9K6L0_9SOLN|nr:hypothetical protein R3W88_029493 [Solanum pinnatisectum]